MEACWVSARRRGFRQPVGRRWQSADSPRAGSRHHGAPGKEKLGLKKSSARRRHRGRADGAARASREELLVLPIREHMGRLRCPPHPLASCPRPLRSLLGGLEGATPGGQPPSCSEGRGAGAGCVGCTAPSRTAPSAPAPTPAPVRLQAKPLLQHPTPELGGELGKGLSRAFLGGIGALLGLRGSGWLPQRAAWVEVSHSWAAAPGGEGLGQMVNQSPAAPKRGSPRQRFCSAGFAQALLFPHQPV